MSTDIRRFGSYIALGLAVALTTFAVKTSQIMLQNERLVDEIVTHAPIGIIVCSENGTIEALNVAFGELVGNGNDELIGHSLMELMPLEYRGHFDKSMAAVMERQRASPNDRIVYTHTRPLLRADGTTTEVVIHAITTQRNGTLKIFGFVTRKVE